MPETLSWLTLVVGFAVQTFGTLAVVAANRGTLIPYTRNPDRFPPRARVAQIVGAVLVVAGMLTLAPGRSWLIPVIILVMVALPFAVYPFHNRRVEREAGPGTGEAHPDAPEARPEGSGPASG